MENHGKKKKTMYNHDPKKLRRIVQCGQNLSNHRTNCFDNIGHVRMVYIWHEKYTKIILLTM